MLHSKEVCQAAIILTQALPIFSIFFYHHSAGALDDRAFVRILSRHHNMAPFWVHSRSRGLGGKRTSRESAREGLNDKQVRSAW